FLGVGVCDRIIVPPAVNPYRVSTIMNKIRDAEKDIDRFRAVHRRQQALQYSNRSETIGGVSIVAVELSDPANSDDLRTLALEIRDYMEDRPAAVVLTALANGRPIVVAAVNEQGRQRGLKAGDLVRTAVKVLKGGGGGKPDIAQGGGTDPTATTSALDEVRRAIGQLLAQ
ncbi:DHHA1 domain-containing protein, partial [Nocardia sp. NPDC058497]|uniref:DHHA1 domain-containing protein n=1 Tax=Nocardia sp. NPDC058497 TaxID=3346529 RepID=UPI00366639CD